MMLEFLCAALAALMPVQQQPTFLEGTARDEQLAKIEREMAKVQSVVARFEQVKVLSLFDDEVRTQGVILFKGPTDLRWEIVDPFRSLLVITERDAAKFDFVEGERRALSLGRGKDLILMVMSDIRNWFRGDFKSTSKVFDLQVSMNPRPALWLTPKNPKQSPNLESIELRLNQKLNLIASVIIRERNGDSTTMTFTAAEQDRELEPALFSTKDPLALNASSVRKLLSR